MDVTSVIRKIDESCDRIASRLEKKPGVGISCDVLYVDWVEKKFSPLFCVLWDSTSTHNVNWQIPDSSTWSSTIAESLNINFQDVIELAKHIHGGEKILLSISTEHNLYNNTISIVENYKTLENSDLLQIVRHCRQKYSCTENQFIQELHDNDHRVYKKFPNDHYKSISGEFTRRTFELIRLISAFPDECKNHVSFPTNLTIK